MLAALAVTLLAASPLESQVDSAVQPLVEAGRIRGVAVALVRGKDLWVKGYGHARDDRPGAPDGDTLFEVGSITKVFTGLLLAEEAKRGRLKLTDPVAQLFPAGLKVPTWGERPITLEDLATQSSGLPRMPGNFHPARSADPFADYDAQALRDFLASYALTRAPGQRYEYSNLGFGLLGFALQSEGNAPYEALLIRRVLEPLALSSTRVTLSPALRERLSPGHRADGQRTANWRFDALAGCGALKSSAHDLARLIQLILGVEPSPLAQVLAAARTPRRPGSPGEHIGLAWHIHDADGVVWHNGGTGGYRSYLALDPARGTGVVVLANQFATEVDGLGLTLLGLLNKPL